MVGEFGAALAIVTVIVGYIFWTMRGAVDTAFHQT